MWLVFFLSYLFYNDIKIMTTCPLPLPNNKIENFKLIFQSNFLKNPNHNIVIVEYFPYEVFSDTISEKLFQCLLQQ